MGTWAYAEAGQAIDRPDSTYGLHVDGPLTVEDWKRIMGWIVDEMACQARREAEAAVSENRP